MEMHETSQQLSDAESVTGQKRGRASVMTEQNYCTETNCVPSLLVFKGKTKGLNWPAVTVATAMNFQGTRP